MSEKNFLESETGLKIVQTGVGEVSGSEIHTVSERDLSQFRFCRFQMGPQPLHCVYFMFLPQTVQKASRHDSPLTSEAKMYLGLST